MVGALVSGDHDLAMAVGSAMHYVVIGLGWLKRFHPRVVDRPAAENGAAVAVDRGEIVFNDPGMFGVGWGEMTPAVVVGGYVVYSTGFAVVYSLAL